MILEGRREGEGQRKVWGEGEGPRKVWGEGEGVRKDVLLGVQQEEGEGGEPRHCAGCSKKIHDKFLLKVYKV